MSSQLKPSTPKNLPSSLDHLTQHPIDPWLQLVVLALISVGVAMVASASIPYAEQMVPGEPFYFLKKHLLFLGLSLVAGLVVIQLPSDWWQKYGSYLLLLGMALLVMVLLVGRSVNGSKRWLALGPVTLQVSEFVKVFVIVYLAGYLVRRSDELQTQFKGFLKPMLVLSVVTVLLLLQPDFGAASVIMATSLAMMFLAGARLWQFLLLSLAVACCLALVAVSEPYRFRRLLSFLDPWADQFGSGYQLTQSLIAFGRGEWGGLGFGQSLQKLSYLPEAHTDFIFAVFAEEFGFIGVCGMLGLFGLLFYRAMTIGRAALLLQRPFAAYLSYGVAFWVTLQASINMGVASGALPTKGLTLPFISYGNNALLATGIAIAALMRVDWENRQLVRGLRGNSKATRTAGKNAPASNLSASGAPEVAA